MRKLEFLLFKQKKDEKSHTLFIFFKANIGVNYQMSGCRYPPDIITNTNIIGICDFDFSFFVKKIDTNQFFLDYDVTMNEEPLDCASLEKLPFSELVRLADKYGVDVPEDLDRRFLIAELLELSEESERLDEEMLISSSENREEQSLILSGNFNETQISCVLRNPAWLFVFWNINDGDAARVKESPDGSLKLRICSLADAHDPKPYEAFEVQTATQSQEQYILIPKGTKFIKVELVFMSAGAGEVLAFSPVVSIPQGSTFVNDLQPGRDTEFSPIMELSGMKEILAEQYRNHRHSFS